MVSTEAAGVLNELRRSIAGVGKTRKRSKCKRENPKSRWEKTKRARQNGATRRRVRKEEKGFHDGVLLTADAVGALFGSVATDERACEGKEPITSPHENVSRWAIVIFPTLTAGTSL